MAPASVKLKNPNLEEMHSDYLYHLGINVADTKCTSEIQKQFGDVKFICMGGTKGRMEALARYLREILQPERKDEKLIDICQKAGRYAVYKVGAVLCCSHGLGMSSFSVLLHELLKLAKYAQCEDPVFIRLGTSGGLGVPPGTVVVTKDAYNGYLHNEHEIAILGERICRPAKFHEGAMQQILKCGYAEDNFKTISGNTMGAECFYEGQGRLDGAVCAYNIADKLNFLQRCFDVGIRNIEMEATMFSSLTYHVGVKAADVCVTLLNRLNGDQVELTAAQKEEFEQRPMLIVGRYIQNALQQMY